MVRGDEADRHRFWRRASAANRSALRRRCAGWAGAQCVRPQSGCGASAAEGRRFSGRRSDDTGEQLSVLWCRGWHHAERSNHSWVDHHDQHQQRHPATTPATSSGAAAGRRASRTRSSPGGRHDGRGDSGSAADHRASARTATAGRTTTTATTTGLAAHANDAGDGAPCQDRIVLTDQRGRAKTLPNCGSSSPVITSRSRPSAEAHRRLGRSRGERRGKEQHRPMRCRHHPPSRSGW